MIRMTQKCADTNDGLRLAIIDTSTAEKQFTELLKHKRTMFLNGVWGSGKTTFLDKVAEIKGVKMVRIDLWNIKDQRTAVEIGFRKIHPIVYYAIRFTAVLAVALSLLMTPAVNIGLGNYFKNSWYYTIGAFVVLLIGVYQFFKIKSDSVYVSLFSLVPIFKKTLVIDDFDRVSPEKQKEAYRLFNILNGKLPIVFVGDFSQLSDSKEYLSKIIDQRVELPLALSSADIWSQYLQQLEGTYGSKVNPEVAQIFQKESLTLRDRDHVNRSVTQEFVNRNKLGRVDFSQQLLIIFMYLFKADYYEKLLDGIIPEMSSEYAEAMDPSNRFAALGVVDRTTNDLIHDVLSKKEGFPIPFLRNVDAYLLYENVNNLSESEAEAILRNRPDLEKQFSLPTLQNDFYQFVEMRYADFDAKAKETLQEIAIAEGMKGHPNSLNRLVIGNVDRGIMPRKQVISMGNGQIAYELPDEWEGKSENEIDIVRYTVWKDMLTSRGYAISDVLFFLEMFNVFSYKRLSEMESFTDVDEARESSHPQAQLMVELLRRRVWSEKAKWNDSDWERIVNLDDRALIDFLLKQQMFTVDDDHYVFWQNTRDFNTDKAVEWGVDLKEILESRILQLERSGVRIVENTYTDRW